MKQPSAAALPHPMQPVGWDDYNVVRFKKNMIVSALLDYATKHDFSLNHIAVDVARGLYPNEDQVQLAQLIGYSVSGFGDLSYVPHGLVAKADQEAERISKGGLGENPPWHSADTAPIDGRVFEYHVTRNDKVRTGAFSHGPTNIVDADIQQWRWVPGSADAILEAEELHNEQLNTVMSLQNQIQIAIKTLNEIKQRLESEIIKVVSYER